MNKYFSDYSIMEQNDKSYTKSLAFLIRERNLKVTGSCGLMAYVSQGSTGTDCKVLGVGGVREEL